MFGLSCRASPLFATTPPFTLRHGPLPMRSRALTAACPPAAGVLRYARQVPPAPVAFASDWQRAPPPVGPPRSAPSPGFEPRKKLMADCCACAAPPALIAATHSAVSN